MQDLVRVEGAGADVEAAVGTEVMQALRRLTLQALDTQQAALSDNGSERFPRTADLAMPITCRRPGGPREATGVIYLYNSSSNRLKVTRAAVAVDAAAVEFVPRADETQCGARNSPRPDRCRSSNELGQRQQPLQRVRPG